LVVEPPAEFLPPGAPELPDELAPPVVRGTEVPVVAEAPPVDKIEPPAEDDFVPPIAE
jgi:hypothetical protein